MSPVDDLAERIERSWRAASDDVRDEIDADAVESPGRATSPASPGPGFRPRRRAGSHA